MRLLTFSSPPRRVLVICIRRLGDVLLCTALIRSLRRAWPQARIDVLVNAAAAPVLVGNADIDEILVQPEKPRWPTAWRFGRRLLRRYDLAVCTLYNDRPHLYALLASGRRAAVVPPETVPGARWKRWMSSAWCVLELGHVHAVEAYLALATCLGIERVRELVPPRPADAGELDALLKPGWRDQLHAVVHPTPMYRYKAWTVQGWTLVVQSLLARGLFVYLTGGRGSEEAAAISQILDLLAPGEPQRVQALNGSLSFAALTPVIESAQIFIGPDTSVTHLAAATGAPTVALFGPSHPVAWGPWPRGWDSAASPWQMRSALQHQGNVWLLQGELGCVPCLKEGCEGHLNSRADCLEQLPATRVIDVIDQVLGAATHTRVIPIVASARTGGT